MVYGPFSGLVVRMDTMLLSIAMALPHPDKPSFTFKGQGSPHMATYSVTVADRLCLSYRIYGAGYDRSWIGSGTSNRLFFEHFNHPWEIFLSGLITKHNVRP